jgi:hypothetical protein
MAAAYVEAMKPPCALPTRVELRPDARQGVDYSQVTPSAAAPTRHARAPRKPPDMPRQSAIAGQGHHSAARAGPPPLPQAAVPPPCGGGGGGGWRGARRNGAICASARPCSLRTRLQGRRAHGGMFRCFGSAPARPLGFFAAS